MKCNFRQRTLNEVTRTVINSAIQFFVDYSLVEHPNFNFRPHELSGRRFILQSFRNVGEMVQEEFKCKERLESSEKNGKTFLIALLIAY